MLTLQFQPKLCYSNGEQHEADSMEDWDGDINDGIKKSGTITLPIQKLSSTSSLKSIRMKFDASSQDEDNESMDKTFDLTHHIFHILGSL